ncbi:hypothetical protein JN11_04454 [Mucilaginibacter frigoritolerans]|uniref:Uncharacterized protein n=1 Tax=Mucilaginibacter frigoritolerans TaxID=652788 RepID=A0A562TNA3_9SPHI|nr:hypothetical protein [Mucilaginibacter frigoritolerans]TWI95025.1 hypothetical protein JN11_04454 [Mucilaginibacter frigoritolerans]
MATNEAEKFDEDVDARLSDIEEEFGFSLIRKDKADFTRIREAINETAELMKQGRFPPVQAYRGCCTTKRIFFDNIMLRY